MNGRNPIIYKLGRNIMPTSADNIYALLDAQEWDSTAIEALCTQADMEKVVLLVHRNAQLLNQHKQHHVLQQLSEMLQQNVDKRTYFIKQIVPGIRSRVTTILEQANLDFLFIKGSSLNGYPGGYLRQMNDLDMMFKNWDDLFLAAKLLRKHDWRVEEIGEEAPWLMDVSFPQTNKRNVSAHINLVIEEEGEEITLDFHTSPFQVCYTGVLDSQIWQRLSDQNPHIPTAEDKLLILVAHAVNHGYFLLKDLNDAYAILAESQGDFDWDYFCKWIEQSILSYAASYILTQVRHVYGSQYVPQQVADSLKSQYKLMAQIIRLTSEVDKKWEHWAETLIYTLHTLIFEKARFGRSSSIRKIWDFLSWRTRFSLLQSPIGDYKITQYFLHSTKSLLMPTLLRGRQILILPIRDVCEETSPEAIGQCLDISPTVLQDILMKQSNWTVLPVGQTGFFVRSNIAELVLTPIGWFIPTIDGVFREDELAALEKLVADLVCICTSMPVH